MDEREAELAAIAAMVREHLEWEAGLAGTTVPEWDGITAFPGAEAESPVEVRIEPVPPAMPSSVPLVGEKRARLAVLADAAASCTACSLHEGRTRSVFARGNVETLIAFVGEGPGAAEDEHGLPFVGEAGQLLDKMIVAMGFDRDEVYVCNVVKCRTPDDRPPHAGEAAACDRFLTPQLEIVAPRVIVALGHVAAETLGCAEAGRSWRGMWGAWRGIPVMPTYHPAFLLKSPEMKRPVWEDLQKVLARVGRAPKTRA